MTHLAVKEIPLLLGGDKTSIGIGKKESPHILGKTRKEIPYMQVRDRKKNPHILCRDRNKFLKYWMEIEGNSSYNGQRYKEMLYVVVEK